MKNPEGFDRGRIVKRAVIEFLSVNFRADGPRWAILRNLVPRPVNFSTWHTALNFLPPIACRGHPSEKAHAVLLGLITASLPLPL
jgi:hypothetical protein